jgi:hypothetical protein
LNLQEFPKPFTGLEAPLCLSAPVALAVESVVMDPQRRRITEFPEGGLVSPTNGGCTRSPLTSGSTDNHCSLNDISIRMINIQHRY